MILFLCFMFEKLSFCDRSGSSNVYKVVVLSLKLDFSVRYEAPNIELQLSGEITGSLRTLKVGGLWLSLISELSFSLAATTSYISMTLVVSEMLLKSATSFLLSFISKKEIYLKTDLRVFSGETSLKPGNL